jgi:ornithine--oxo-acid transaminase
MKSAEYIEIANKYSARNYLPLDVVIERGEGVWLYDIEGRKYLDCLSAYSAVNQGHCHPKILKTATAQSAKLTLTSRAFRNIEFPMFCKELCELLGYQKSLLMNSGAEAVETAVKVVRKWGYTVKGIPKDQAEIIVCKNNFHGRTTTIISFSSEEAYKKDFGPFTPGFKFVPHGDIAELEKAITKNTCAFLIEPIQGESGVLIPPDGYLKKAKELCEKHNVLFVADEIQTGLGRTGKLLACEHENVRPDVVILGKALAGGFYPVSAVISDEEVLGIFQPGDHGSTFGGNALACAIGRTALKVIVEEKLVERSEKLGAMALEELKTLKHENLIDVRGRGLMIALELNVPARPFCEKLKDLGILCKETHSTIIRITPPLIITEEDLRWAVSQIKTLFA